MKYISVEGQVYKLSNMTYLSIRKKIDSYFAKDVDKFHEALDEIRTNGKLIMTLDECFNY